MDQNYVGRLFINEIKNDGKVFKKGDKYLRGTINGMKVVGFLSKDGTAFNIKEDIDKEDSGSKSYSKKSFSKNKDSAPF
jgi:hypothetical protein